MGHSSRVVGRVHKKGSVTSPAHVAVAPNPWALLLTRNLLQDDHIDQITEFTFPPHSPVLKKEKEEKEGKER
jgi:hypothetical protein